MHSLNLTRARAAGLDLEINNCFLNKNLSHPKYFYFLSQNLWILKIKL
jgi:hypothetical protein